MIRGAAGLLALTVGVAGSLTGQAGSDDVAGRWAVRVQGQVMEDVADLRLGPDGGRILFESADSLWLPLEGLQVDGTDVRFRLPGQRMFVGRVEGEWLRGRLHDPDAPPAEVVAQRIQPGTDRWPVRPRVTIRELVVGTDATISRFTDAWRDRLLPRETLLAEHARLASALGLPAADLVAISRRAQPLVLGELPAGRAVAEQLLARIATGPAADAEFRALFGGPGAWRLDLHDAAWWIAAERVGPGPVSPDRLLADLEAAHVVAQGAIDTTGLRRLVWELARQEEAQRRGGGTFRLPGDPQLLLGIHALLAAYQEARSWWVRAVGWLLSHPWIETEAGHRSPAMLVDAFWGGGPRSVPPLEPTDFGGLQAVPVMGIGPLARALLQPANAIAAEWLERPGAAAEVLEAWRTIVMPIGAPLPIVTEGRSLMLRSPAEVVQSRLGGFIAAEDRILIDPTILPIFAVGTVVHEWQHLLLGAARLQGDVPPGWRTTLWGVRLLEGDPWLSEGAAEWITEQVLAPAATMTPVFAFTEAEKRLSLGADRPEDTHVLGYLLVRSAATRVPDARTMRDLLVTHLAEPGRLATALRLDGAVSFTLPRPNTLMVIPEMLVLFDAGTVADLSRRLIVPLLAPEPD
ncbi:MAG: hypothetical protein R3B35_08140 [Gemmatimonadales bacterium]